MVILAILAVPMLVIAIAISVSSPGPIFFRQLRVGRGGRFFTIYKFRSMREDAESRQAALAHLNEVSGPIFKIKRDPRLIPVGRIIRRLSLDEAPQLFNVLKGEMSLVGPRPALMREVLLYEPWQLIRLTSRPGMTGIWQISGRSEVSFEEMMAMDMRYVRGWSLWLDLSLLLRTVPALVRGRGAY
jgi:lipopolysaccharide/colanic/teichoic acid biosynthesis glycosyltransferase